MFMATMHKKPASLGKTLSWYLNHSEHSVWDRFNSDQQRHMVDEDLAAGRQVTSVLFALITTGMVLSMITLLVVLATTR
jgi:hypothetical protein